MRPVQSLTSVLEAMLEFLTSYRSEQNIVH